MEVLYISIKQRYSLEILDVRNQINLVRRGHIYEISNVKGDGYAQTRADNIEQAFNDLLDLIEKNAPSALETISSYRKEGNNE